MTGAAPTPIAVNLLWCVPGRVGGSEEYLVRQLLGLTDVGREFAATLYCLDAFVDAHPDLVARVAVETAPIDGTNRARRVAVEHTWLARRTSAAALVHHGGGTVPARPTRPVVLTIHDLQWLTYPEYVAPVKRRYLQWTVPRSVHRADVVVVPTEYVRASVIDAFDADPKAVVVVPHGVEADLGARVASDGELRRRYALGDRPYVVHPAITHPHKGHRFLLDLLATRWRNDDVSLVLLGGAGAADAAVASAVTELGLEDRVVRPGRVPAADRDGLIIGAEALVFPSEYEGFGAPVIEAMTLGTPVIASDRAALPEVVGDAGLVLPLDLDAWSGALDTVRDNGPQLVAAGHERVESYTAARSGAALADAYRFALKAAR
ncbi:MAG: glycosyltransferase family 1 protein [Actinomycetota bacterium]